MAYKYDILQGGLRPTTQHLAYGLQGLKPPLPINHQSSKLVWAQNPGFSDAKKIQEFRAVLQKSNALIHLKGPIDRLVYIPTLAIVGAGFTLACYKLYQLAFKV